LFVEGATQAPIIAERRTIMIHMADAGFDWIERRSQLLPDKEAIVDLASGRRFTYREFNQRTNRIAIIARNCPEFLEAYYAAGKLGAILVAINVRAAGEELIYLLNNSEPRGLILGEEFLDTISDVKEKTEISNYISLNDTKSDEAMGYDNFVGSSDDSSPKPDGPIGMDDPRLILYTSGTTGYPKGAVITNGGILFNCINVLLHDEQIIPSTLNLSVVPFFHIAGLNITTNPTLLVGGTAVIMKSFDAGQVIRAIDEKRVNTLFLIATMWKFVSAHPDFETADFSGIRIATGGSETLPFSLIQTLERKGILLTNGYGLTESGPCSIVQRRVDTMRKPGSIGLPTFHTEARVVNGEGLDVPPGETGEILLRGPSIMAGYWKNPAGTAEAIRDGWLYTGDLGFKDEDGHFFIRGRKKELIISGGENIYPAEVERFLSQHPAIAEATVFGVPDERWGEVGHAVVCPKAGKTLTREQVIDFLGDKIARFKIPKYVTFMDELPKAASGKVAKRVLQESYSRELGKKTNP
jgi:fatty-acyl-CoA synthase